MIAIQTKYLGPTNTKGDRIRAWTHSGFSATVTRNNDLDDEAQCFEVVKALVKKHKLEWDVHNMVAGSTRDGFVFVFK